MLLVRRGDDRTNDKLILESWNNVNLDPNSSRFIAKVIGDQILEYSQQQIKLKFLQELHSQTNQDMYRVKTVIIQHQTI
jgi:hypothetical protein